MKSTLPVVALLLQAFAGTLIAQQPPGHLPIPPANPPTKAIPYHQPQASNGQSGVRQVQKGPASGAASSGESINGPSGRSKSAPTSPPSAELKPSAGDETEAPKDSAAGTADPGSDRTANEDVRWHTDIEIRLSYGVLVFGLLSLVIAGVVILKRSWPFVSGLKIFGLIIVITAGLFLIAAGYSQTQTASTAGLLGSIVGYILGKDAHVTTGAHGQGD